VIGRAVTLDLSRSCSTRASRPGRAPSSGTGRRRRRPRATPRRRRARPFYTAFFAALLDRDPRRGRRRDTRGPRARAHRRSSPSRERVAAGEAEGERASPIPPRVALLTPFARRRSRQRVTVTACARLRARASGSRSGICRRPARAIEAEATHTSTLVHAFHAYRAGPLACSSPGEGSPLLVTITGTDPSRSRRRRAASSSGAVLEAATGSWSSTTRSTARIGGAPRRRRPDRRDPQSVWLPTTALDLDAAGPFRRPRSSCPAGIVPWILFMPLAAFDRLVERRPATAALRGPVIDATPGGQLHARWRRALGAAPRHVPHGAWRRLSVGDWCSTLAIEGGWPLRPGGMAAGRPVWPRARGNRSLVEDGVTGFVFDDAHELEKRAEQLVDASLAETGGGRRGGGSLSARARDRGYARCIDSSPTVGRFVGRGRARDITPSMR